MLKAQLDFLGSNRAKHGARMRRLTPTFLAWREREEGGKRGKGEREKARKRGRREREREGGERERERVNQYKADATLPREAGPFESGHLTSECRRPTAPWLPTSPAVDAAS